MIELPWNITGAGRAKGIEIQLAFYFALMVVVGPIALLIAWLLSRQRIPWYWQVAGSLFSLVSLWVLFTVLPQTHREFGSALFWWWGGALLAVPIGVPLIKGWRVMFGVLRPRDLAESLEEQKAQLDYQNEELSRKSRSQELGEYLPEGGYLNLGVYMKGSNFPDYVGVKRDTDWLLMQEELLNQHMLIVGATGAGKTETIKRLISEVLRATDRDIFLIDGKGEWDFAQETAQLIYAARNTPVPIFRLGGSEKSSAYHGFCGERMDIHNRLMAVLNIGTSTDNSQWYETINRGLLQLVSYAKAGPPRCIEEVIDRLNPDWLKAAYQDNRRELNEIEEIPPERYRDLKTLLTPLYRDFGSLVGPEGFVMEESRGSIFSLRTQSVGDTARRFINFLVEDVKDFIGKRQKRPGLLIIDEFGVFKNESIIEILMLARSAQMGVVLATQDVASLGEEKIRDLILANTRTKLLLASDFPEKVAELAGTVMRLEASVQHEEGGSSGMGSARIQHQFQIDMNEAARLRAGEGFLIRQRYTAKFRTKRIDPVQVQPESTIYYSRPPENQEASLLREAPEFASKKAPKRKKMTIPDLKL